MALFVDAIPALDCYIEADIFDCWLAALITTANIIFTPRPFIGVTGWSKPDALRVFCQLVARFGLMVHLPALIVDG